MRVPLVGTTLLAFALAGSAGAVGLLPDFSNVVETTGDAVVNIATTHRAEEAAAEPGAVRPFDELFRRFFGDQAPDAPEPGDDTVSTGSGFIISTDGFIITNHHVVRGADEILVTLADGRQYDARLVGYDEETDLALLRIDASALPVVRTGDSSRLRVGEWVLAIGSPFGFEHSVTAGIVSAKARSLRTERFVPFIQTDVAINPGNSGGPLFNLEGEVVGVNSQIYSRNGGYQGVSFAIPIEVALDVVSQLRDDGRVRRGWLGVNIQDVSRDLARSFGLDRPQGALVSRVRDDSPAKRAGLLVGDVIVELDGRPVERSAMLPQLIGSVRPQEDVRLVVLRNGERIPVVVRLEEAPGLRVAVTPESVGAASDGRLGVQVADLEDSRRRFEELSEYGVLVTQVDEGAARRGGLREGDVILRVDRIWVRDAVHFAELAAAMPATRPVAFLVQRSGVPVFLAVERGAGE